MCSSNMSIINSYYTQVKWVFISGDLSVSENTIVVFDDSRYQNNKSAVKPLQLDALLNVCQRKSLSDDKVSAFST